MKAFKVVSEHDDGVLRSAWISNDKAQCVYGVGKPTQPNEGCGPLSAFEDLDAAREFCDWMRKEWGGRWLTGRYSIYSCEADVTERVGKSEATYLALWAPGWELDDDAYGVCYLDLPEGTVLCSEITLLEEVE